MTEKIVLVDVAHETLKPLTCTRSVSDIEVAGQTVFEHIRERLGDGSYAVSTPEYLEEVTRLNSEIYRVERAVGTDIEAGDIVYNSSIVPTDEVAGKIEGLEPGQGLFAGDEFIAACFDRGFSSYQELMARLEDLTDLEYIRVQEKPVHLEYPWDLVEYNGRLMEESLETGEIKGEMHETVEIVGDRNDFQLGENSEVGAYTVIDVSGGPVVIDSDTRVWPNSRIEGPAYIGSETKIGAGQNAVIHENTHVGNVARAGGEIEESIIHSFSNKYHYGYFGHGVAGSWVNFGAGTTNSDLKNTYGTVRVDHPVEGEKKVGQFVGATLGDHTKMDIGTLIYTGKQVGPVTKLNGVVDSSLDPFTWYHDSQEHDYRLEAARDHLERMMARREEHLPEGYVEAQKELIEHIHENEA
ncbi:MAG: putative sugar nucleotidyl transferase [Candidatus Nanohaloarchaea archaeon]